MHGATLSDDILKKVISGSLLNTCTQIGPSSNKWRFFSYIGNPIANVKLYLIKLSDFKIVRHVIVKNMMLADDTSPEAVRYWEKRDALKQFKVWGNYESRLNLAKKQFHICPICNETLYNEEELHVHHILPKKAGGKYTYGNLVILHEFCHRQIHSLKITPKDMHNRIFILQKAMRSKLFNNGKQINLESVSED